MKLELISKEDYFSSRNTRQGIEPAAWWKGPEGDMRPNLGSNNKQISPHCGDDYNWPNEGIKSTKSQLEFRHAELWRMNYYLVA